MVGTRVEPMGGNSEFLSLVPSKDLQGNKYRGGIPNWNVADTGEWFVFNMTMCMIINLKPYETFRMELEARDHKTPLIHSCSIKKNI